MIQLLDSTISADDWSDAVPLVVKTNRRGMQDLVKTLDGAQMRGAASALLALPADEMINICTGFPVAGMPETDGPAGALVLAAALSSVGKTARLVSYAGLLDTIAHLIPNAVATCMVPCGAPAEPLQGKAVCIEVCGRTADGSYRNIRGVDVAAVAPWIETAIGCSALVAIGDGGNEFGMGSAAPYWFKGRDIVRPISTCAHLVPAEVSNWGALGVVAAMAKLSGRDLLPTPAAYDGLLAALAAAGLVDGIAGLPAPTEDGWPAGAGGKVVAELRRWAALPAVPES